MFGVPMTFNIFACNNCHKYLWDAPSTLFQSNHPCYSHLEGFEDVFAYYILLSRLHCTAVVDCPSEYLFPLSSQVSHASCSSQLTLPSPNPRYLSLSTAVFADLVNRWDPTTCNGGLHWQILPSNPNGYSYKNSAANGGFFQLCARLYRYTSTSTYLFWAEKSWDWMSGVELLSTQGSAIHVYDGTQSDQSCSQVNRPPHLLS
jgi:hypothetical protein